MSCASCVRMTMMIFNFFFTLLGLMLIVGGLYFYVVETEWGKTQPFGQLGAVFLGCVVVGVVTVILGILGWCGACNYSRCTLGFYFVISLVLFAAEVSVAVMAFLKKDEVLQVLKNLADSSSSQVNAQQKYGLAKAVEVLFGCCLKEPCGGVALCDYSSPSQDNLIVIGACLLVVAVVQFLGLIFSSILCCAVKDHPDYSDYQPVYH